MAVNDSTLEQMMNLANRPARRLAATGEGGYNAGTNSDVRTGPAARQPEGDDPTAGLADIDLDNLNTSDEGEKPEITDAATVQWIMNCRREAYDARRTRMRLNNINRDCYMGIQDWRYKQKGQSLEFLPKVTVAAEQFAAFIKKSLIQFGDWFSVELSQEIKPYITEGQIRELMKCYLGKLPAGYPAGRHKYKSVETVMADAGKSGLLESLIVLKVYGKDMEYNKYSVEGGDNVLEFPTGAPATKSLKRTKATRWHLCVDLIRNEDYFPDPTGRGLYEIHEFERDYIDVLDMARAGAYDLELVKSIRNEDFPKPESVLEQRRPQQRGQDRAVPPAHRHRVLITEFWGTVINPEGEVVGNNLLATVANKKYLVRKPMDNPFWHDESPFIAEPLIRVPQSVWHKALYDSTSNLNFAMNEIFNLLLDGGIAAVWGIKQLRTDLLSDPRQVEDGIPQGATLAIKSDTPDQIKVLEQVSTADPAIVTAGMAIFDMLNREFNQASLTNDIQLGTLPQRQVKATEIVQANQSNDVTLSSISMDMETSIMEVLLHKSWLTMLQHFDDMNRDDIIQAIGQKAALLMMSLSEAERFAMFAGCCSFKASGLSAVLAATQDFQKLMAFFQAVSQNQVLMHSFLTQYDPTKVLNILMKHLNINPDDIALTQDQQANLPQVLQQIALFSQLFGQQSGSAGTGTQNGQGGAGPQNAAGGAPSPFLQAPPGSSVGATAAVNQQIQPLTGLNPGA